MTSMLAAVRRAATNPARAEGEDPPAEDEDGPPEPNGEEPPPDDDEEEEAPASETTTTTTTSASGADAIRARERARVLGIQAAAFPGQEALAAELVADGRTTPEQAALRFNQALKASGGGTAALARMDRHVKVPANQRGAAVAAAAVPQTAEGWKAEYAASAALQDEFATADAYAAYMAGTKDGRIRILRKAG